MRLDLDALRGFPAIGRGQWPPLLAWLVALALVPVAATAQQRCKIRVIDRENRWPVPLVELRTTHDVRFVSDNAGLIAFDLPELMGVETWFHVRGHGYTVPADGFGYRGVRLTPQPGVTLTVSVDRQVAARRLGRTTGAGIFAESQQLGESQEWREQGILGCDSLQLAEHQGKLHWVWGDTRLAGYPLGLFDALSATTSVVSPGPWRPPIQWRYQYVADAAGRPRSVAPMLGDGPTWLSGLVSLPLPQGQPKLAAMYYKIRDRLIPYRTGLCVWNETTESFVHIRDLWARSDSQEEVPLAPTGHPVRWKDAKGITWLLFGDPFPTMKCRNTYAEWSEPERWIALKAQSQVPTHNPQLPSVVPHRGCMAYWPVRKRWVAVFTQIGGHSPYGELWYAEAPRPTGPWSNAVKVVTHDNYTFYNPCIHRQWLDATATFMIFEATFTSQFADNAPAVPRHNYNQVLYRLDVDQLPPIP